MDAAFARGLQHLADAAGGVVSAGGLPKFAEHSFRLRSLCFQDRFLAAFP